MSKRLLFLLCPLLLVIVQLVVQLVTMTRVVGEEPSRDNLSSKDSLITPPSAMEGGSPTSEAEPGPSAADPASETDNLLPGEEVQTSGGKTMRVWSTEGSPTGAIGGEAVRDQSNSGPQPLPPFTAGSGVGVIVDDRRGRR